MATEDFTPESAASRYDRDYAHMGTKTVPEPGTDDDRAERQLHRQHPERSSREYVDWRTGVSATGHSDPETTAKFAEKAEDANIDLG